MSAGRSPSKLTKMPPIKMPSVKHSLPSYSTPMKRHASFDSPAEIPLPTPSPSSAGLGGSHIREYPFPDVAPPKSPSHRSTASSDASSSSSMADSIFSKSGAHSSTTFSENESPPPALGTSHTILPHPRPYSVPDDMSPGLKQRPPMHQRASTLKPLPSRRSEHSNSHTARPTSSASLPLPHNIPFTALPKKQDHHRSIINRMTYATALPLSSLPQRNSAPTRPSASRKHHSNVSRRAESPRREPGSPKSSTTGLGRAATVHHASPSLDASQFNGSAHSGMYRYAANTPLEPPQILDQDDRPVGPVAPATPEHTYETMSDSGCSTLSSGSVGSATTTASAPYVPFLSQLPAPNGTYLEVETKLTEYVLHVRLPGFKRDAITLATKRGRVLHVVADSWADTASTLAHAAGTSESESSGKEKLEDGTPYMESNHPDDLSNSSGGHFERRISFGHDADVVQIRAEFDGEMLRVYIPRKTTHMFSR